MTRRAEGKQSSPSYIPLSVGVHKASTAQPQQPLCSPALGTRQIWGICCREPGNKVIIGPDELEPRQGRCSNAHSAAPKRLRGSSWRRIVQKLRKESWPVERLNSPRLRKSEA